MCALLQTPIEAPSAPSRSEAVFPAVVPTASRAHRVIAYVLLAGLALQLFFAGLGVFGITTFLPHVILGTVLVLGSLSLPVVARLGRLTRPTVTRSFVLAGLMILQGLLIDLGRIVPIISALHPVNAMLLVLVTYHLARRDP